jgi:hypothetical protein
MVELEAFDLGVLESGLEDPLSDVLGVRNTSLFAKPGESPTCRAAAGRKIRRKAAPREEPLA